MRTTGLATILGLSAVNLMGCFAVGTQRSGYFYGGGSIGLFVIIVVLALLFGKRH
jgi:hypothetical protein